MRWVVLGLLLGSMGLTPAAVLAAETDRAVSGLPWALESSLFADAFCLTAAPERRRIGPGAPFDRSEMPAVVARPNEYLHWTAGSACVASSVEPSVDLAPVRRMATWRQSPLCLSAVARCALLCRLIR